MKNSINERLTTLNSCTEWTDPDGLEAIYGFSKSLQSRWRAPESKIKLPHYKVGKKILYNLNSINEFIKANQVKGF